MLQNKAQGRLGEARFRQWMDRQKIPFFAIEQERGTLSKGLKKDYDAKRPDFVILIPKIGLILVDVKYLRMHDGPNSFWLTRSDIRQYANLEKSLNYKVWFAFLSNSFPGTWHWISAIDVRDHCKETRKQFTRLSNGRQQFIGTRIVVPIANCIRIDEKDSLGTLLVKVILKK